VKKREFVDCGKLSTNNVDKSYDFVDKWPNMLAGNLY